MENKQDKKWFPDASISFDIEVNEETNAFIQRMFDESKGREDAIRERIMQLFNEHIQIEEWVPDDAKTVFQNIFSIGYQLGWNDMYNAKQEQL